MDISLKAFEEESMKEAHNETRKVLDHLRSTRKSRGGVGAPLVVPASMKGGTIILTDSVMKDGTPDVLVSIAKDDETGLE